MHGFAIRPAAPHDVAHLASLAERTMHPEVADEVETAFDDPEVRFFVAAGDGIGAMAAALPVDVRIGGVAWPAATIEFVATEPHLQGRGLATALVSAVLDHLAEAGIPTSIVRPLSGLYAHLGFRPAMSAPPLLELSRAGAMPPGWRPFDGPAAPRAHVVARQVMDRAHVSLSDGGRIWDWSEATDHYEVFVVEREDGATAAGRLYTEDDGTVTIFDITTSDPDGASALIGAVTARTGDTERPVVCTLASSHVPAALRRLGARVVERDQIWLRTGEAEVAEACRGPVSVSLF